MRYALALSETADTGEYVQLEFRVRELPTINDSLLLGHLLEALNSSDAFIIARPPTQIVHGTTTFGIGYGVAEAIIRTTGLAIGKSYSDVLANVINISGGSFTLIDQNYVDSIKDTQLTNGTAPPLLKTGDAPSPVNTALAADPVNPFTGLNNLGASLKDAAKTTGTVVETLTAAIIIGAVAWLVMEWKK